MLLGIACLSYAQQPVQQPRGNVPGRGPAFTQTPDPEYVIFAQRRMFGQGVTHEGRSSNNAPTFFIYPDTKLTKEAAEAFVAELGIQPVIEKYHASVLVLNPVGAKYDAKADFDAFVEMFNKSRTGNLKVIAFGQGATFVNAVIAPKAAGYIAGIMTVGGNPGKIAKTDYPGVPSYVAGKNAKKVAKDYELINASLKNEPLLQVVVNEDTKATAQAQFEAAWAHVFSKNFRYNNYKHTHYEGGAFEQYGVYELEPFLVWEELGIQRNVVEYSRPTFGTQGEQLPWLWYEYWPEELMHGVPDKSVPVMVLLHGNANDPRTQAETSGFVQVADKEHFFVVEMEWQGSRTAAAMGLDGIESVLYMLFEKYPQLDPSRVYCEGLSAGSMTSTLLGVRKSHVFAAVGGHSGGLFGKGQGMAFSNYTSIMNEAIQKSGLIEMPYCSVLGTADRTVPFFTPDNYKDNSYLNAWNAYQVLNGIPVINELDFNIDPVFGFQLADRQTIQTNKGEGIVIETGQLYKGNTPLIRIVAVMDYGHWNFIPTAQIMWDFFKQYSRNPSNGRLIYHGN